MELNSEQLARIRRARELFDPRSPVSDAELLAGRTAQTSRLIEAIEDPGAHTIVYGDRGVGKTSIACCVPSILEAVSNGSKVIMPRVNCHQTDDFDYLWRKVFWRIKSPDAAFPGFRQADKTVGETVSMNDRLTPFAVQQELEKLGSDAIVAPVLDEFDRLQQDEAKSLIADLMKNLSDDRSSHVTIVVVGVAESVIDLIGHHGSLGRHLIEIRIPRLAFAELGQIVVKRLPLLGMNIEPGALGVIAVLSRGLPYYVHLLARSAAVHALGIGSDMIKMDMLAGIMNAAITDSQTELAQSYYDATKSPRKDALHAKILAACALADCDEFGYFRPGDIKKPLEQILGKTFQAALYNGHLAEFASDERGKILERTGEARKRRYRFADPMIQPFVLMKSYSQNIVTLDQVAGRDASAT